MLVDTHVHIASPDRERYPLKPGGVGSAWFRGDDVGVDALLDAMDKAGVDRTVVVQAIGAYGYDCAYATDAVRAHAQRLTLVGSVDMDGTDPAADLEALDRTAGDVLTGVRVFGVLGHEPVWLGDGRADQVWELAARLGITVVPALFPAELPALAAVVARHPEVPVALDHAGFPDLTGGTPFPDAGALFALAAHPAVRIKISTHLLEQAQEVGDAADLVDRLAAVFGAERLAWGSDFPQTQDLGYGEMVALARHSARRLSEAGRTRYLGGTATELWGPRED